LNLPQKGHTHPLIVKLLPSIREGRDRVLADRKLSLGVPFDEKTQELLEEQMSVSRALIDTNAIYPVRLVVQGIMATSGAGVLSGFVSFDPSNIPLPEYASLQALFDMVRLAEAKISFVNINPHADGYATGQERRALYVSCDAGLTATTPGSIQTVIDCPNTLMFCLASDGRHSTTYKMPNRNFVSFARTTTPAPGPYAGCFGQFQWYQSGLAVSTNYCTYYYEGIYEFTSRS